MLMCPPVDGDVTEGFQSSLPSAGYFSSDAFRSKSNSNSNSQLHAHLLSDDKVSVHGSGTGSGKKVEEDSFNKPAANSNIRMSLRECTNV